VGVVSLLLDVLLGISVEVELTSVEVGVSVGSEVGAGVVGAGVVVHGFLVLVVGSSVVLLHPTLGNTQPQAPV